MFLQIFLTVYGKNALFPVERAAKGNLYRLNLEGLRTAVRTSIITTLSLGSAFDAKQFVAGSSALDRSDRMCETDGALLFFVIIVLHDCFTTIKIMIECN